MHYLSRLLAAAIVIATPFGGTRATYVPTPLAPGLTALPGTNNAGPAKNGATIYPQAWPTTYTTAHTVTAAEMSGTLTANSASSIAFTLPVAGTTNFESGQVVCFIGQGSGGFTIVSPGTTNLFGPTTFAQNGSACATSDPVNSAWSISGYAGLLATTTALGTEFTTTSSTLHIGPGGVASSMLATGSAVANIATNGLTLTQLPQAPANTVLGNATGTTGNVTTSYTVAPTDTLIPTASGALVSGHTMVWNGTLGRMVDSGVGPSSGTSTTVTAGAGLTTTLGGTGGSITTTGTLFRIQSVNAQVGVTYTVLDSDQAKLVTFSNASAVAIVLPQAGAASTFLTGWNACFQNKGAGTATITPTISGIDGSGTLALVTGAGVCLTSDGTNYASFRGMGGSGGGGAYYDQFTANGTWTKRAGVTNVRVELVGAGGGGAGGALTGTGVACSGGNGGSGGFYREGLFPAATLASTETVTVPAGGTGGAASTTATTAGSDGGLGSAASFGAWLTSYNTGGGGGGQPAATTPGQAGGAGIRGNATSAVGTTAGTSGSGNSGPSGSAWETSGGQGPFGSNSGAGGGGNNGGRGGGSGGQGAGISAANAVFTGGSTGFNIAQALVTGGTAGNPGTAGVALGAGFSLIGAGGGSGGGSSLTAAGNGGAGGVPGGGGGGGACGRNANTAGAGGAGGRAEVRVWSW